MAQLSWKTLSYQHMCYISRITFNCSAFSLVRTQFMGLKLHNWTINQDFRSSCKLLESSHRIVKILIRCEWYAHWSHHWHLTEEACNWIRIALALVGWWIQDGVLWSEANFNRDFGQFKWHCDRETQSCSDVGGSRKFMEATIKPIIHSAESLSWNTCSGTGELRRASL